MFTQREREEELVAILCLPLTLNGMCDINLEFFGRENGRGSRGQGDGEDAQTHVGQEDGWREIQRWLSTGSDEAVN